MSGENGGKKLHSRRRRHAKYLARYVCLSRERLYFLSHQSRRPTSKQKHGTPTTMSKELIHHFFPTLTSLLSSPDVSPSFFVDLWNKIFPDDVSRLCSLPPSLTPNDTFRQSPHRPCLAIAAIIGAIIGLKHQAVGYHRGECFRREGLEFSIHDAWSKSRRAFGLMNVVAMVLHCVLPSTQHDTNAITVIVTFLWAADCIFTGISSINLILVALLVYSLGENRESSTNATIFKCSRKRTSILVHTSIIVILASLSLLFQFRLTGHFDLWVAASTCIEMMYIVPLILASVFLFPVIICNAFNICGARNKTSMLGARIAILGVIVVVTSVAFDSSLCFLITDHASRLKTSQLFNDIYHLPTLVFVGCDISFGGLGMWVNAVISCALEQKKKAV
jgi:hypothetical protein